MSSKILKDKLFFDENEKSASGICYNMITVNHYKGLRGIGP